MTIPVLLDCDTGVDDTMALLLAALSPAIELVGVGTTWGNVETPLATRNTLNVLSLCGRDDVPVAPGELGPSDGSPAHYAYYVHGHDGQGDRGITSAPRRDPLEISAAELIVRLCSERPGEIELVPVGPLTNIAKALELEPRLPSLVRGVTVMGGAALVPGNATAVAEANIWHDPEAAATVFAAPWPITMVGLDVTLEHLLTPDHFDRMRSGGTIGQYMARIADFYANFYKETTFGVALATMHDALAVAVASGIAVPSLAPVVNVVADDTHGPGRGQTVCDLRGRFQDYPVQDGAHCRVVLEVEDGFPEFFTELIVSAGDAHIALT